MLDNKLQSFLLNQWYECKVLNLSEFNIVRMLNLSEFSIVRIFLSQCIVFMRTDYNY